MARSSRSPLDSLRAIRGGQLALIVAGGVLFALLTLRFIASLYVNVLWFRSVGYEDVLWSRLAWTYGMQGIVGLGIAAIMFANLRLVVGSLVIHVKRRFGDLEIAEQLPRFYVLWVVGLVSAFLGLWMGGEIADRLAIPTLLATKAPEWGVRDPVFAQDLSFYVFQLPLVSTAITFSTAVVVLLLIFALFGYAGTGTLRWVKGNLVTGERPRIHLGALVAVLLVLIASRLWIGRYMLLLDGTSEVQGIFGYTDAQARLPALKVMTGVTLLAAAAVFWGAWRNRFVPVVAGLGVVLLGGILGVRFYPSLVQRFRVVPNQLAREAPYIETNIRFTRLGFGLDDLQRARFKYLPPPGADWDGVAEQLNALPVWSGDPLLIALQQMEARFRYYDFPNATIDRYPAATGPAMVALAVRELERTGIEDPNWQNLHLRERYLSGMGAVGIDASDRSPEGQPVMVLNGIPPEFHPGEDAPDGLRLERSAVFFGMRDQPYAILNPDSGTFLAPDSTPGQPGVDFPEGVLFSSPLRTVSFAWHLGEANLLFASEVTPSSRMVINRQVTNRAQEILPFLRYPDPPQPVVQDGRLVWILDGFTVARQLPLAQPHELEAGRSVTYARNSVRVVVDEVTGAIAFYRMPDPDPILEAYDRSFPGLFKSFDEMPGGLKGHLRYSRRLLDLQAQVLLQYHQDTPQQFHAQQDVWATPTELMQGESPVPYRPEYGLWRLPGEDKETFLLSTVFVPAARQNLTAILSGRVGPDGRRELFLHEVAVEDQAPGPRQIEALVEQDPIISQQFSLWRTGGSRVWTGHLHVIPSGDHILYMEPIYLASAADAIPELRRYVVSDGKSVAMEPTLAETLAVFSGAAAPSAPTADDLPGPGPGRQWPADALELLQRAETNLKAGDYEGFGTALRELRDLLERLSNAPGGTGG